MQHFLITGGAGFLGSWVCELLLQQGARVTCLDNLVTGQQQNVEHLHSDRRFQFVEVDVTDPFDVDQPIDCVMHLASPASPAAYSAHPLSTLRAGSLGTENALRVATKHHARCLLASTSEVYGDPLIHPQPESYWGNVDPIGPRSMYDEAKRYAEALCMAYHRSCGTDVTIARIFNTYGPRMDPADGRVVPTFVRQALTGAPLTVHGHGKQTRSLCFVRDTAKGLLRLASSRHTGPMNIGNDHEVTVRELAETINTLVGEDSPVELVDRPAGDPERRCPDVTYAQAALGWRATTTLTAGLTETIAWFSERLNAPPVAQPMLQ